MSSISENYYIPISASSTTQIGNIVQPVISQRINWRLGDTVNRDYPINDYSMTNATPGLHDSQNIKMRGYKGKLIIK